MRITTTVNNEILNYSLLGKTPKHLAVHFRYRTTVALRGLTYSSEKILMSKKVSTVNLINILNKELKILMMKSRLKGKQRNKLNYILNLSTELCEFFNAVDIDTDIFKDFTMYQDEANYIIIEGEDTLNTLINIDRDSLITECIILALIIFGDFVSIESFKGYESTNVVLIERILRMLVCLESEPVLIPKLDKPVALFSEFKTKENAEDKEIENVVNNISDCILSENNDEALKEKFKKYLTEEIKNDTVKHRESLNSTKKYTCGKCPSKYMISPTFENILATDCENKKILNDSIEIPLVTIIPRTNENLLTQKILSSKSRNPRIGMCGIDTDDAESVFLIKKEKQQKNTTETSKFDENDILLKLLCTIIEDNSDDDKMINDILKYCSSSCR